MKKEETRVNYSIRCLPTFYLNPLKDLYFDFALGFRICCRSDISYKIKLFDDYTDRLHHTFFTKKNQTYYSDLKYFIRWRVEVYLNDKLLYTHILNLKDQIVIFEYPGNALGDFLATISAVD